MEKSSQKAVQKGSKKICFNLKEKDTKSENTTKDDIEKRKDEKNSDIIKKYY